MRPLTAGPDRGVNRQNDTGTPSNVANVCGIDPSAVAGAAVSKPRGRRFVAADDLSSGSRVSN